MTKTIGTLLKTLAVAVTLSTALSGCIVVPYGPHYGHDHRDSGWGYRR